MQYYDISARSNYNFEETFLWLARKLAGDPNLEFTAMSALESEYIQITEELKKKLAAQLEEVVKASISDNDDEDS
ncbi:unnamed protein product [Rotaria sp. Silwood2]|nr:unnamed protein product [Rotaria sp. Silwood2]CAF4313762.1 unnamed protein product [Rotaria sp. Silwood2]